MGNPEYSNRLSHETSPYLLQHAHNPVDWYPWGPEALDKAKKENKPIFLSIGYSSCHWCHAMAKECFENETLAGQMNEGFVNIKVDREERPDVDAVYIKSLIEMTGEAGWPLSMFLTPDLKPYWGGTYFPPEAKSSRPGFAQVLSQALDLFVNKKSEVEGKTQKILDKLIPKEEPQAAASKDLPGPEGISRAVDILSEKFDADYGGFGVGMKFPDTTYYHILLRHWLRTESDEALQILDKSLTKMAEGGMYDQLGGGFHRYSTDREWLVPHFEKMLYDNALLARLYLDMYQATKQEIYQTVPDEIFSYVMREMTSPEGGFYCSQDADTRGREGDYYLWDLKEVLEILGPRHAKIFALAFGVTSAGNFEGKNILRVNRSLEAIGEKEGIPIFEVNHIVKNGKRSLFERRVKREAPFRDEKILTGWNGLMITALAAGHQILRDKVFLGAGKRCAEFLWDAMWKDHALLRVYNHGAAHIKGCLEDYAYYLEGLINLYESSFETIWIERARQVAGAMISEFLDARTGGFFIAGKTRDDLFARLKNPEDDALPSPNAVAALSLLRLGHLTGKPQYIETAEQSIRSFKGLIETHPAAHAGLLAAVDFASSAPTEVVFAGPKDHPAFEEMEAAFYHDYRPNRVLVWNENAATKNLLPLAEGKRSVEGAPAVYLCQRETCHPPAQTGKALIKILERPPEIRINIFDEEKKAAEMKSQENVNFLGAMDQIFKHSGLKKK